VISNHLENEERFRTPELLRVHGVRRAINVILQGDGHPYGVLEVDSRSDGEFSENDIAFLQGAANILGMAIERRRYERNLKTALDHHKVLLQEISHRVKNSLQLVSSLLGLQAQSSSDETVARSLNDAVARIGAVARIHERLYRTADIGSVDLAGYLAEVCQDLAGLMPLCSVEFAADAPMTISTDRAVRAALLVTELVTNAAKHAYPEGSGGPIRIALTRRGADEVTLTMRDEGQGLPADFDLDGRSLGMRIIRALVEQTGATLTVERAAPGTAFLVTLPIEAPPTAST
jgi:two-component sensor histidine kinase